MSSIEENLASIEERILAHFRERYLRGAGFVEDRATIDELVAELRPVVDTILVALSEGRAPREVGALEHREAWAMMTLFGRRVGGLGVTPSSAFVALEAFLAALASERVQLVSTMDRALSSLFFEGFIAAREERLQQSERKMSAESQPVLTLSKACMALILSGHHESDALATVVDRFARMLLRANASSCLVDITHLANPSSSSAAEVFSADASARMLGAACIFSGVSPAWREAGVKARVPFDLICTTSTFEEGARLALEAAGHSIREDSGVARWLRRRGWRGRR